MADKPTIRVQAGSSRKAFLTQDSFQNFAAALGQGTNNLSSASTYGFNPISRLHTKLEWMYRGSWMVRKVVDCPADDMTRAGIDFTGSIEPDHIDVMHNGWKRLAIWQRLNQTIKWGRLYGGAIAVMMIDGQDLSTPLREDTVGRGQFKGLLVLDRWMVTASVDDFVDEYGPQFGMPKFYTTVAGNSIPRLKIHFSRIIRMEGDDIPYWQRIAENGWTISVVEQLFDRLLAYDSASTGAAQLVYKAHLRTYKVPNLRELIAAGGAMYQAFLDNMAMIRVAQTNEGLTIIDGDDSIEYHTNSAFSGLSDAMVQFGQQVSGASGIPLVILFGQSPAGLNSTGESDIRNYYDRIKSEQTASLEQPLLKVSRVLYRSLIGNEPPGDFGIEFNSLWQQTEAERASNASTIANAVKGVFDSGIISQAVALEELRQSSHETGVFTNISDKDIEEAKLAPPPAPEGAPPGMPGAEEGGAGPSVPPAGPAAPPSPAAPSSDKVPPASAPASPAKAAEAAPADENAPPPGTFRVGGTPEGVNVHVPHGAKVHVRYNTGDDAEFRESDHPRAPDGRFGSKPGSSAQAPRPTVRGETPPAPRSVNERGVPINPVTGNAPLHGIASPSRFLNTVESVIGRDLTHEETAHMLAVHAAGAEIEHGLVRADLRAYQDRMGGHLGEDPGYDFAMQYLNEGHSPGSAAQMHRDMLESQRRDYENEEAEASHPSRPSAAPAPAQPAPPQRPIRGRAAATATAAQLRPDPAGYRDPALGRYVTRRLSELDTAAKAPNPAEALAAVGINQYHPRLHAYRNALLAEIGKPQPADTKKPPAIPKRNKEAFTFIDANAGRGNDNTPEAQQRVRAALKADPHEMAEATLAGFSADAKVATRVRVSGDGTAVTINSQIVEKLPDGSEAHCRCERDFYPKEKRVYHSLLTIDRNLQGNGTSQRCLAASVEAYKKAGYVKVDVFAALDVGGYAWAKYGFVPRQSEWNNFRDNIKRQVRDYELYPSTYRDDPIGKLSDAERASLKAIGDSENPRAMWALSDHPSGKHFLLGQSWHGQLDLNDEVSYKRCMDYAAKGFEPKPKKES